MKIGAMLLAGLFAASLVTIAPAEAEAQTKGKGAAQCVQKGGRGTGGNIESARFQAWEAVLQATSWPMWASWMASGAKVGQASAGYNAKILSQKCGNGGSLGKECIIWARLCQ